MSEALPAVAGRGQVARPPRGGRRTPRSAADPGRWVLRAVVLGYLVALVAVPVGLVFYRALSPGLAAVWRSLTAPDALHALWLTLVVTTVALAFNTLFGVGTALLLARRPSRITAAVDAVIDLPIAMSPVVVGLGIVLFYGRTGWAGSWLADRGVQLVFHVPGIIIASAFVSLPYVVRAVLPVLQETGTEQEQAAATLGAGPFTTFRRVTVPTIRWGVVYGVTVTTARILGEFGAVSVVSGLIAGKTETLTLLVDDRFQNLDMTGAYMAAVLLAVIAVAVLGVLTITRSRQEGHRWPSTSAV